jgi:hypothetical protein
LCFAEANLASSSLPRPRSLNFAVLLRSFLCVPLLGIISLGLTQTSVLPAWMRLPTPLLTHASTRDDRWRQDVDYLASQLKRLHADAFFQTPRAQFDAAVSELDANIPSLSDTEIVAEMLRLVAMLGDGHTQLFNYNSLGFHRSPLQLEWFGDALYVVSASPQYRDVIGMRVERIGGMSAHDASAAVIPYLSHYNEFGLRKGSPVLLTTPEILLAARVIDSIHGVTYDLVDSAGSHVLLTSNPVPADTRSTLSLSQINSSLTELPLYLRHRDQNYWYAYLPDSQTVYFQYNSAHETEGQPFDAFVQSLFEVVDSSPVQRVVVDLRFNGGGYPVLFDSFLEGLRQRPSLTQPGRLFVLTGNITFSSGVWHAVALRDLGAVVIGEPTSGKPNAYGQVRRLYLPNSGIGLQYSTRYWKLIDGSDPSTVMPDVLIEPTITEYFAGRDVVLEAAVSYTP